MTFARSVGAGVLAPERDPGAHERRGFTTAIPHSFRYEPGLIAPAVSRHGPSQVAPGDGARRAREGPRLSRAATDNSDVEVARAANVGDQADLGGLPFQPLLCQQA